MRIVAGVGSLAPKIGGGDRRQARALIRGAGLGVFAGHCSAAIESRLAAALAAGLVRLKADVIVTGGTANVAAVKQATSVIPVVFAAAGDPVANGLVESLARPGGNLTGLSVQQTDLGAKRLEVFRELIPRLDRLTILANVENPITVLEMREVQAAARSLGLHVNTVEVRGAKDIAPAIAALKGRTDGIYIQADPLLNTHRIQINTLALSSA